MRYSPGTVAPLPVIVTNAAGALVDPDAIVGDIYSPAGLEVQGVVPERDSLGRYHYDFLIPGDADHGFWKVEWTITMGGLQAGDDEVFEVAPASLIVAPAPEIAQLRMVLAERIPVGKTDADTNFMDEEIALILTMGNGVLERSAAIGWAIKGGEAVELIPISENGSDRDLSKIHDHCYVQWKMWDSKAAAIEATLIATGVHRVVGVAAAIWDTDEAMEAVSMYAEGKMDTVYIRAYPLKRFPAVLGA